MSSQRNNPYCDLLHFSSTNEWIMFGITIFVDKFVVQQLESNV